MSWCTQSDTWLVNPWLHFVQITVIKTKCSPIKGINTFKYHVFAPMGRFQLESIYLYLFTAGTTVENKGKLILTIKGNGVTRNYRHRGSHSCFMLTKSIYTAS